MAERRQRLAVDERELAVLQRALREALAAELLRPHERDTAHELVERIDARLPDAATRHPHLDATTTRLTLRNDVLRVLADAEERLTGGLRREEIDRRLTDKPEGTSVRQVLDELRREKLIRLTGSGQGRCAALTPDGRARARRPRRAGPAAAERAIEEPEQLLDLIYRDSCGPIVRYRDREEYIPGLWHLPTVQAVAGLPDERLAPLLAALEADGLIAAGPSGTSYRGLTDKGDEFARSRWREHQPPGGSLYGPPRLLPPARRPGELLRRHQDLECPNCGTPANWLKARRGKRWESLRKEGIADYRCVTCDVVWLVYAEPVDARGEYDPIGDPRVSRPRWRYRGGFLQGDELAPPDHHPWSGGDLRASPKGGTRCMPGR